jgi:ankyrin repeat protein
MKHNKTRKHGKKAVKTPLPSSEWEYTENNPGKFMVKDAFFGFLDGVKATIKKNPEYVNYSSQYYDGMTALIAAARGGHENIVKFLLSLEKGKKVDQNAVDSCGKSAKIWAKEKGHLDILEMLK